MKRTILFLLAILMIGCTRAVENSTLNNENKGIQSKENKKQVSNDIVADGLKKHIETILAAVKNGESQKVESYVEDLKLPEYDTWFKSTFGDKEGARFSREYRSGLKTFTASFSNTFDQMHRLEQTDVTVIKVDSKSPLVSAMKRPTDLYYARVTKPGETIGMFLFYFVQLDDHFRYTGFIKLDSPG
jgi:hypothetical protein